MAGRRIRALREAGYAIPALTEHGDGVKPRDRATTPVDITMLPEPEEMGRIGKAVLVEIAQQGGGFDAGARVKAASLLVDISRVDAAAKQTGRARTAKEMLAAIRRALPELERRAAEESGASGLGQASSGEEPEWG